MSYASTDESSGVLSGDGGLNRCLAVTKKFYERQKMTQQRKRLKRVAPLVGDSRMSPEFKAALWRETALGSQASSGGFVKYRERRH